MITRKVYVDYRGNVSQEFFCLSTDNKDDVTAMSPANGDPLTEIDTADMYMFDQENQQWWPQQ